MIPRFSNPKWKESGLWKTAMNAGLEVELAAARAMFEKRDYSSRGLETINAKADFDSNRIDELEQITNTM
jgi:adenylosuccinate lyase